MNNSVLLLYAANILPILTLVFVGLLILYRIYFKVRSKYSVTVNCWFCNENSKVPFLESNSWTCTKCEQYNGFTKDGDYNREIIQQYDCNASSNSLQSSWIGEQAKNGFCDSCNEAQRLKVEKLSQFEPKKETRFDEELRIYKEQLEDQYRLCATCDRHLNMVLRGKKKMVLGSKFLEYVMEGAKSIKQPKYLTVRHAKHEMWKQRLSQLITLLTALNLFCLLGNLPELNRNWFLEIFGVKFGSHLFILSSHVVALWRVLTSFVFTISQNGTLIRLGLFTRTVFMMLLYSLGLRLPQIVRLNFCSLYMLVAPFCILISTFSYNLIDKFKLSRFTFLLALWSTYAGGLLENNWINIQQYLMVLTSILTCVLAFTNKVETSPKLHDRTTNSFHKIYSDDCFSEEYTIASSYLSSQLDCSSISSHSNVSRSFKSLNRSKKLKSPLTSSTLSLNVTPRPNSEYSLNTSFRSCFDDKNSTLRQRIGSSTYNLTTQTRNPFYCSSPEVFSQQNAHSSFLFGNPIHGVENKVSEHSVFNQTKQPINLNRSCQSRNFHMPLPTLRTTFSASSNTLHDLERPSRLLSPTRFNTIDNVTTGFATTTNRFGQSTESVNHYKQVNNLKYQSIMGRPGNLCPINEDLSRASSRSSGFESQSGYVNNSRENSFCTETNDLNRRTLLFDNSQGFRPVENQISQRVGTKNIPHPSLLSPTPGSNYSQPLSVNCSTEWHTNNRLNTNLNDSFNLRQFNQDLPSVQRGELLRKWMEKESFVSSN